MADDRIDLIRRNAEVINSLVRSGPDFADPEEHAPDLWARLAPDFELHERSDLPDAKVYRGRDATKEFWRKTQEVFAEVRWDLLEFVDLGHAVVVQSRVTALGRGSDVRIDADETDVFWFRDGALVRLAAFPTRAEGLAAARESAPT